MGFSLGSHHFRISVALLVGVAVGLWLVLHFGSSSAALEQWLAGAQQEVQATRTWWKRTHALSQQAASARKVAAALAQDTLAQRHTIDSLVELAISLSSPAKDADRNREAARIMAQAGAVCDTALGRCKARGDSLAIADSLDRLRADSAERRVAIADSTIKAGIAAKGCRILVLVPCLSREATFFLGVAAGGVAVWAVHK